MLFGIVPVRQVLRADPWQVIRTGGAGVGGLRRFTVRDVLLAVQIAICAVLVTSSLVAVRGLARSLHSNFGFVPQNVMLAETDLQMAGYTDEQDAADAAAHAGCGGRDSGSDGCWLCGPHAAGPGRWRLVCVHRRTTDFRPTNQVADAMNYNISPGYFAGGGHDTAGGKRPELHDDSKAPIVAVVNREFARKVFGSVDKAIGGHFKFWGGNRAEVVGVVEDGKYRTLTEDQQPAMFYSFLQQSVDQHVVCWCGRSAIRRRFPRRWSARCTGWTRGCRSTCVTWNQESWIRRCLPRGWRPWRWECWGCWARCWR